MYKKLTIFGALMVILMLFCSCTTHMSYNSESISDGIAFESVYNASLQRVTMTSWLVGSLPPEEVSTEQIAYIQGYLAECNETDDCFTFSHAYADYGSKIVKDKEIHTLFNSYDDAAWRFVKEMERLFLDINVTEFIDDELIENCRKIHDTAYDLRSIPVTDETMQEEVFLKLSELTDLLEAAVEKLQAEGSGTTYSRYTLFYPTGHDGTKFSEMDG